MPAEHTDHRLGCTDCERIRSGPIAQPVNTATSLAFIAAAGIVVTGARRSQARKGELLSYAALLALVGVGSVAFHGPQPRGAKALHDWPIVGLLALTAATAMVRAARGRRPLPGWSRRRGLALVATTSAAALAWVGGRTSASTCHPDSAFQLHGCWHVLAAAGFVEGAALLYDATGGS